MRAKIAGNVVTIAIGMAHADDEVRDFYANHEPLDELTKVKPAELAAHVSFYNEMGIVYVAALFDSFLFDATMLLGFMFPERFFKGRSVPLSQVAKLKQKDILNTQVREFAKDQTRYGFLERVRFLEKNLGVNFEISEGEEDGLKNTSQIRNSIVHTKSVSDIFIDGRKKVQAKKVERKQENLDLLNHMIDFDRVVLRVHGSLRTVVLKSEFSKIEAYLRDGLEKAEKLEG